MHTSTPSLSRTVWRLVISLCLVTVELGAADAQEQSAAVRPNILFVIFDDWGPSTHASISGSSWIKTPNFDWVAREGVLFTNAFTSNPKCTPSRASILTGRNSWQLREGVQHYGDFPAGFEVYPEVLEKAGYVSGFTGKGWSPGDFSAIAKRGHNPAGAEYNARRLPAGGEFSFLSTDQKKIVGIDYAGNLEVFLSHRPDDQPFSFWMGFFAPHRPYESGIGVRSGKRLADVKVPAYLPDVPAVRSDLLDYAVMVEWADAQLGKALEVLEAAGELDRTLIVVTSDNGMPFPHVKGQIREDAVHMPLAMRWKGVIQPGRVVSDFVNFRDFAPTFLEAAGLKPTAQMTGRSVMGILRAERSGWVEGRDEVLMGKERHDVGRPHNWGYPVRALRTKEFLYVHNFFPDRWPAGNPETDLGEVDRPSPTAETVKQLGGYYYDLVFGRRPADELYRITDDPECVRNLAHDLAFVPIMAKLRARMMQLLREDEDPRALGRGEIFDTYRYTGPRREGINYNIWLESRGREISKTLEQNATKE